MKVHNYQSFLESNSKVDIDSICEKYGITNYTINDDGSIDVDGDVNLSCKNLTKLPLKFRDGNLVANPFDIKFESKIIRTFEGFFDFFKKKETEDDKI
jgi:hypothetical protein